MTSNDVKIHIQNKAASKLNSTEYNKRLRKIYELALDRGKQIQQNEVQEEEQGKSNE